MANLVRRENPDMQRERRPNPQVELFRGVDPFRMMDALMQWDPFRENRGWQTRGGGFMPHFDVKETHDGYKICADLPGVKEDDVEVSVTGNMLTVSGHREEERRDEQEQYFTMERSYGSFTRSFTLPEGANSDNVKAALADGVLTIQLPKKPEVQPRRISVGSRDASARSKEEKKPNA